MIKIKKGLDLPIDGAPAVDKIDSAPAPSSVAVIGFDYHGMKPTMHVQVGDKVAKGQLLFEDKKTEGVLYTAPAAGVVKEVNRGPKRVFQSVVIEVEGDDEITFKQYDASTLASLDRDEVVSNLVASGMWTSLRTRPFSKVPALDSQPAAVFVNAMDTNPLAAPPQLVINESDESKSAYLAGLDVLSRLSGKVFVCSEEGVSLPQSSVSHVQNETFAGKHPAGLAGTHVHYLMPVSEKKQVITVNYQDAMAIGRLFLTGSINLERVVSVAGPAVKNPRVIKTVVGAKLSELLEGELETGDNRVISGSVLSGRHAQGPFDYLGRTHLQITVLAEGRDRPFMGWMSPGSNRHSFLNIYLSAFNRSKKFKFNTNTNGSARAMVPVGVYEDVMPLDILPTQLLRALIVGDMDTAIKLGALELDEEDLALCTYVCPGKYEYGPILRDNLTTIEKEG